ncbi:MAG: hypothetical protein K0S38_204 [Candidatus Paceibacter sp.]|jgi:hypothetical protein|nr:hypothetical protein [Candidatus Paceibacter sp.]
MSRQLRFKSPCGLNGALPTELPKVDPYVGGSELVEGTYDASFNTKVVTQSCRPDTKASSIICDSVSRAHEDRGCD